MERQFWEAFVLKTLNYVELDQLYLIKTQFEVKDIKKALEGGSLDISCQVTIDDENKDFIHVSCDFSINGFNPDESLFEYVSKHTAGFSIQNSDEFLAFEDEEISSHFMRFIFPTIRDDAMTCLSRAGLRQIILPHHFQETPVAKQPA